jgi:hypothetical protein
VGAGGGERGGDGGGGRRRRVGGGRGRGRGRVEGRMWLLASLPPLLCALLFPTIGLVVLGLLPVCQAIERRRPPLRVFLRGNAGRGCIGKSSSLSRRDGAGGRGAVLPAATRLLHHSVLHASLWVGDHVGGGVYCAGAYSSAALGRGRVRAASSSAWTGGGNFTSLPVRYRAWFVWLVCMRAGVGREGVEGGCPSHRAPYHYYLPHFSLGGSSDFSPRYSPQFLSVPPQHTLGQRGARGRLQMTPRLDRRSLYLVEAKKGFQPLAQSSHRCRQSEAKIKFITALLGPSSLGSPALVVAGNTC